MSLIQREMKRCTGNVFFVLPSLKPTVYAKTFEYMPYVEKQLTKMV
jgi:hypothetical protein